MRLIQPVRADEPGAASSTSSMAVKCERLATGNPTAWIGGELAGLPQRLKRPHRRMQAEHGVRADQRVLGDGDGRPRLVVAGSPWGTTTPRPSMPPRRLITTRVLPPGAPRRRLAASRRRTSGSPPCRRPARPPLSSRIGARARSRRSSPAVGGGVGVGHRRPQVVMWSGVSSRAMARRGNSQPPRVLAGDRDRASRRCSRSGLAGAP